MKGTVAALPRPLEALTVTLTALTGTAAAFYSIEGGSVRLGYSRNLHIRAVCVCFKGWLRVYYGLDLSLKVHKIENFFGFDFEICTFS